MRVLILAGPTAGGKSALALDFARKRPDIEIVSADSLLVYRQMNIGTAKPSETELAEAPHHLINIREPHEAYNAGDFAREARVAINEIHGRGKRALMVGGTGFYLKALLYGLWEGGGAPEIRAILEERSNAELYAELYTKDPESALRIGGNDRYRLLRSVELLRLTGKSPSELQKDRPTSPDPQFVLCVVDRPDPELEARIRARTHDMITQGLVEETEKLESQFPNSRALGAIGYAQVRNYLRGIQPPGRKPAAGLDGLESEIRLATRQLVKNQRTWFRGESSAAWFVLEQDRSALERKLQEIYGEN